MNTLIELKRKFLELFSDSRNDVKYSLHKWKNQLIFADKIIYIIAVILAGLFRPDIVMIVVYVMLYPYLYLTARKSAFYHLYVSSAVALIWVIIANDQYGYNKNMFTIFGLNSYPLFSWACGLFAAYLIYSHWEHKFKPKSLVKKMLLFIAFYLPILIAVETVAYYVLDIKNLTNAVYVGLPICNCIHAPPWMQAAYLLLGPIYFGICELIGLENPHHIKNVQKIK